MREELQGWADAYRLENYEEMITALDARLTGEWLDQHSFDAWATASAPSTAYKIEEGQPILGTMHGGFRDEYLDLLQRMMRGGFVEAEMHEGSIRYRMKA